MVIPIGGMGVPMQGPPPAELAPIFEKIKVCVLTMWVSMLGKLLAGLIYLGAINSLLDSLNLFLNTVVGVFLMRDDPQIGRIYKFLSSTCCGPCAENCGGGMSCLMSFIICNAITIAMQILLDNAIGILLGGLRAIFTNGNMGIGMIQELAFAFWVIFFVAAFVAQVLGAWFGWKAYSQARAGGTSSREGTWGGGNSGGPTGANWRSGGAAAREAPSAREGRPASGFHPFTGGGQRLGT